MAFLSEFEFDIKHIKGKENKVPDALSTNENQIAEIVASSEKTYFS